MVWRPNKTLGAVIGMIMLIIILGTAVFLAISSLRQEPGLSAFATSLLALAAIVLLALWISWYRGLWHMSYTLTQNALTIKTGSMQHVVPLDTIKSLITGDNVRQKESFRGIGWPGYLDGSIELDKLGELTVCSTQPLAQQLVIVTENGLYGISPAQPHYFVADMQFKRELGVSEHVTERHERTGILAHPAWHDSTLLLLIGSALLLNLGLYVFLYSRFAAIPARIAVSYPAGAQENIIARESLLLLPTLGLVTLVVNATFAVWTHAERRFASHLAAATALIVQAPLLIALLRILE